MKKLIECIFGIFGASCVIFVVFYFIPGLEKIRIDRIASHERMQKTIYEFQAKIDKFTMDVIRPDYTADCGTCNNQLVITKLNERVSLTSHYYTLSSKCTHCNTTYSPLEVEIPLTVYYNTPFTLDMCLGPKKKLIVNKGNN